MLFLYTDADIKRVNPDIEYYFNQDTGLLGLHRKISKRYADSSLVTIGIGSATIPSIIHYIFDNRVWTIETQDYIWIQVLLALLLFISLRLYRVSRYKKINNDIEWIEIDTNQIKKVSDKASESRLKIAFGMCFGIITVYIGIITFERSSLTTSLLLTSLGNVFATCFLERLELIRWIKFWKVKSF